MISLEEWVDVVSLHRQGLGIKTIARELDISRNAVRRALTRGGPPEYHRAARASKLDPFKDYLTTRLADFPSLPAITLFEEIRERGYDGGMSILKDFTYPYRQKRREPVVRFETPPGRQAQVDWAHLGRHELSGVMTPLYLFVMVLGYSRALFAEVVTRTDIDTFLALHVRAFAFFGGMPEEILYDNPACFSSRSSRRSGLVGPTPSPYHHRCSKWPRRRPPSRDRSVCQLPLRYGA